MLIDKITEGYVKQTYDTDKQQWVSQTFTASSECNYETGGDPINVTDFSNRVVGGQEPYLPFDMVQPGTICARYIPSEPNFKLEPPAQNGN
jgi:hypothetical protein